jgi:hypothetical protein
MIVVAFQQDRAFDEPHCRTSRPDKSEVSLLSTENSFWPSSLEALQ